jgi:flagellar export protein FliJ
MAYQPEKGKFKYNLSSVLKVRQIFEKLQQEKLQQANKAFLEEKQREEQIKQQELDHQNDLAHTLQGKIDDFSTVLRRHSYLGKLKQDVQKQEQKTIEAEQKKEEEREKLTQKMLDRKVIEKDSDNKKDIWRKFMAKEDTKFLDDLSTGKFTRNKK